mgnify:CR=1 FL=1
MLLWVRGAPNIDTVEGMAAAPAFIDRYVSAKLPDRATHPVLHDLVKRYQVHRHTFTCGGLDGPCRFLYDKDPCEATRLRQDGDRRLRRGDTYIIARGHGDGSIVPYSPALLCLWGANMDLQYVGNAAGAAAYVTAYLTKAETDGTRKTVQEAVAGMPEDAPTATVLRRACTAQLSKREYSMQEAAWLLIGSTLNLRCSSRSTVKVCARPKEDSPGIAARNAFAATADGERPVQLATNQYDYYAARPVGSTGALGAARALRRPLAAAHDEEADTACEVCHSTDADAGANFMLLCSTANCAYGYHGRCLAPPLEEAPKGHWFCPHCHQRAAVAADAGAAGAMEAGAPAVAAVPAEAVAAAAVPAEMEAEAVVAAARDQPAAHADAAAGVGGGTSGGTGNIAAAAGPTPPAAGASRAARIEALLAHNAHQETGPEVMPGSALPASWEDVSVFMFLSDFSVSRAQTRDSVMLSAPFDGSCPQQLRLYVKRRPIKPAVLRCYPRTTADSHGDKHYWAQLFLHKPWRSEAALTAGFGSALDAFRAAMRNPAFVSAVRPGPAADALEAEVERLRALDEEAGGLVLDQVHADPDAGEAAAQDDTTALYYDPELLPAHVRAAVDQELDADGGGGGGGHGADGGGGGGGGEDGGDEREGGAGGGDDGAAVAAQAAAAAGRDMPVLAAGARMTREAYDAGRQALSPEQRAVFTAVFRHVHATAEAARAGQDPPRQLLEFVTGGGGTGKSFLIKLVTEMLRRTHLEGKPVVLTAPTGVAAFNIRGSTIHRALGLPVEDCRESGAQLLSYAAGLRRCSLGHLAPHSATPAPAPVHHSRPLTHVSSPQGQGACTGSRCPPTGSRSCVRSGLVCAT